MLVKFFLCCGFVPQAIPDQSVIIHHFCKADKETATFVAAKTGHPKFFSLINGEQIALTWNNINKR
jgi:hypothetical protein